MSPRPLPTTAASLSHSLVVALVSLRPYLLPASFAPLPCVCCAGPVSSWGLLATSLGRSLVNALLCSLLHSRLVMALPSFFQGEQVPALQLSEAEKRSATFPFRSPLSAGHRGLICWFSRTCSSWHGRPPANERVVFSFRRTTENKTPPQCHARQSCNGSLLPRSDERSANVNLRREGPFRTWIDPVSPRPKAGRHGGRRLVTFATT